jgi:hypothetical protein
MVMSSEFMVPGSRLNPELKSFYLGLPTLNPELQTLNLEP